MQKGGGSGGQQRGSACAALRPIPARHGIEQAPPGDAEGHPDDARERAARKQTGGGLTSGAHAPPRERGEPGGTPGGGTPRSQESGLRPTARGLVNTRIPADENTALRRTSSRTHTAGKMAKSPVLRVTSG